ncbi:hypothetical protein Tsubulata_050185 [Turnera subulata]|uniref:CCHC-type domain-containing protein n=1 Tax=Turnera subulata TaxID=218843 RepID=A0A9Q0FLT3_9ROSI|nr:hypothetical protein Tsubulata_050185 [Turnera subulata]
MEAEQLNRNLLLFKVQSRRDKQEILEVDKLWFFEKQLVVLKSITGDEVLSQVELIEVPILVQMVDIPLNQRTAVNVKGVANKAGRFICFDEKGKTGWGKFVRAKIFLNVEKPLRKSLMIKTSQGLATEITYRYKGIPNFCYICSKLGHLLKKCEQRKEESDDEEVVTFREWMRASPRKPYSAKHEGPAPNPGSGHTAASNCSARNNGPKEVAQKLQLEKEPLVNHIERVLSLTTMNMNPLSPVAGAAVGDSGDIIAASGVSVSPERVGLEKLSTQSIEMEERRSLSLPESDHAQICFALGRKSEGTMPSSKNAGREGNPRSKVGKHRSMKCIPVPSDIANTGPATAHDEGSQTSHAASLEFPTEVADPGTSFSLGKKWKRRARDYKESTEGVGNKDLGKRKMGDIGGEEKEWEAVGKRMNDGVTEVHAKDPAGLAKAVEQPRRTQ